MGLQGKKVVVLAEDGHEDLELHYPRLRLEEAGADVTVASVDGEDRESEHGYPCIVDKKINELNASKFDAVLIPGGRKCPDVLRTKDVAKEFIREMDNEGNVIGAICHAAWLPISAGVVEGREMTCYHSIKDDVENAGATYIDSECVVDDNLITARFPPDLPHYCTAIIEALEEQ